MASEPKHPTYGTLDDLLEEIGRVIRRGEHPRIGHLGALAWFVEEYARFDSSTRRARGDGEVGDRD